MATELDIVMVTRIAGRPKEHPSHEALTLRRGIPRVEVIPHPEREWRERGITLSRGEAIPPET